MFGSRRNELPGKDGSWRVLKGLWDVAKRSGEGKGTLPLSIVSSNPASPSSWKPLQNHHVKELVTSSWYSPEEGPRHKDVRNLLERCSHALKKTLHFFWLVFMHVAVTGHTHTFPWWKPSLGLEELTRQVNFRCAPLRLGECENAVQRHTFYPLLGRAH